MSRPFAPHEPAELYRRVRRLELVAHRNVAGRLQGDYVTAFKGSGLLFEEPRRYVPGDPVRSIDWNITARVAEPHVRVHREERQRDVTLVVDVSPSMHSGFQRRTKLETAVELAATLAVSAVSAGDRLGHILFADRVLDQSRPGAGRARLWRVLRSLLAHSGPWQRPVAVSDPRLAIHELEGRRGGSQVVFLISDFIDHDVPDDLRYLRPRHDVSVVHVYDPFELEPADDLRLPMTDPEAAGRSALLRPAPGRRLVEMQAALRDACGGRGLGFASVSTAEPVWPALLTLFHTRPRRRGLFRGAR